ncbi:MAG TPA: hypothetical protein VFQ44_30745 [Streptosporangiaceae bacterium]|nr:hypothetical protein [Streptosporangiaceae bacterium]
MRIVLEAMCSQAHGRIVEINDIVRLRQADDATLRKRVTKLAGSVRARGVREGAEIRCVFVHEDFDETDSELRVKARHRVQGALDREFNRVYYVLAAWEVEAWLLLFPEALKEFTSAWSTPARYLGADTGLIRDPKRVMMREVSKAGPQYRESDAPDIIQKVTDLGLHKSPSGHNRSYEEFLSSASDCCTSL